MIQIAILFVSVGLVVLGIKGFTASGIPLTRTFSLKGTSGKITGVVLILTGIGFIPLVLIAIVIYGNMFGR